MQYIHVPIFVFFLIFRGVPLSLAVGSEDCSRNFTSSNGTIESPGFPDKYPHNLDCTFTIMAKPKMEIILQFLTFDLENDPLQVGEGDCKYDWLDIWDGIPQGKYESGISFLFKQILNIVHIITCMRANQTAYTNACKLSSSLKLANFRVLRNSSSGLMSPK